MSEADKRSLKVKAGVVKRLAKELQMYEGEVAAEGAKAQRLRDAGADPHDIKYQVGGAAVGAAVVLRSCWGAHGMRGLALAELPPALLPALVLPSPPPALTRAHPTPAIAHAGEYPGRVGGHAARHAASPGGGVQGAAGPGGECRAGIQLGGGWAPAKPCATLLF